MKKQFLALMMSVAMAMTMIPAGLAEEATPDEPIVYEEEAPAIIEEPVVEEPVIEEPVEEEPVVEEPAVEEPVVEEPVVEEPVVEEPVVEEPVVEEPVVEEPAVEEPAVEEPAVEEPVVEEPVVEEPVEDEELVAFDPAEETVVERSVRIRCDASEIIIGEEVTFRSELEGFDGVDVEFDWQRLEETDNGEEWRSVPGGNGAAYTFTMTEELADCQWRLLVNVK